MGIVFAGNWQQNIDSWEKLLDKGKKGRMEWKHITKGSKILLVCMLLYEIPL